MSFKRKKRKRLKELKSTISNKPEVNNPENVSFNYGKVANWRLNLKSDKYHQAGKVIIK